MSDITETPIESFETRKAAYKIRLASVTSREDVLSHLNVPNLPLHLHGEWERNDPQAIARKIGLGYIVDTKYATMNSLYGNKTEGSPTKMGDVIFMITDKANYAALEDIRADEFAKRYGNTAKKKVDNKVESDVAIDTSAASIIEEGANSTERIRAKEIVERLGSS